MSNDDSKPIAPKFIWLQPWCNGCAKHDVSETGRLWCEDDVWGKCDECGLPSVKYTLAGRARLSSEGE